MQILNINVKGQQHFQLLWQALLRDLHGQARPTCQSFINKSNVDWPRCRTSYRTAILVEMVILTTLVSTLSLTSGLGKVSLQKSVLWNCEIWCFRLVLLSGSGQSMERFREPTRPNQLLQLRPLDTSEFHHLIFIQKLTNFFSFFQLSYCLQLHINSSTFFREHLLQGMEEQSTVSSSPVTCVPQHWWARDDI